MNIFNWFRSKSSDVYDLLKAQALRLTMLDGKPGLSPQDVGQVIQWMQVARDMSNATNEVKFKWVVDQISQRFGSKLPAWVIPQVTGFLYQYAKGRGIV